jgi:hypothetical protein
MERSTYCCAGMVMSPAGYRVRLPHTGSGRSVKVVVPLSPSVMPSPLTVTVTDEVPGFRTRMDTEVVSAGVRDTGSAGTDTATERAALRLGAGDAAAATALGTTKRPVPTARTPASHPLAAFRIVALTPTVSCSWVSRYT